MEEAPKIEFPCPYPVKVMGANVANFQEDILLIFRRHAPDELLEERIAIRTSGTGKWVSVTITITATGKEQLEALFVDLKASGLVTLVL